MYVHYLLLAVQTILCSKCFFRQVSGGSVIVDLFSVTIERFSLVQPQTTSFNFLPVVSLA